MSKLWEVLASRKPATDSRPVLQVAVDGQWERAQVIPLAGEVEAAHAAVTATAAGGRILAMEILWPGTMFVGTAWHPERHGEAVPAATRAFAALGGARRSDRASPAMTGLTALLGAAPEGEPESADLGAVNAWLSVGHEPLWRRGETYSSAAVDSALDNRPDLTTCTHPVAVEFAIPQPRGCWVAIFVSTPHDGVHHLDRQRLHEVLAAVTEPSR